MSKYTLLVPELEEELVNSPREIQESWLILEPSQEFDDHWVVDCIWPDFFFAFEDIIGPYRVVGPKSLPVLFERCAEGGYQVAFTEDPTPVLKRYADLDELPPFSLNSNLEGTQNGMLPWQIRGFNKLVRNEDLRGGLVIWSTGTGKTAFIASAIKWHAEYGHPFDIALVVVKSNNKIDTHRKLKQLGNIESFVIDGTKEKRLKIYELIDEVVDDHPLVLVTNYEKIRDDKDFFLNLLDGRDVLIFWDEMPTKLRSRGTQIYNAVGKALYKSWKKVLWHRKRPNWLRQWELTATPIENMPEDQFSCVRLIDPDVLGTKAQFRSQYVLRYNYFKEDEPKDWHKLDHLRLKLDHMTDIVDRDDPEVAHMFPTVIENPITIDWDPKHRKIYDILTGKAVEMLETDFSEENILAMISVMQMICDSPSILNLAASRRQDFMEELEAWIEEEAEGDVPAAYGSEIALKLVESLGGKEIDDKGHTKLETLKEILTEKHPNDKLLLFTTWNAYGLPYLSQKLDEWGVTYVVYSGTDKQRQLAKELFKSDPSIQVFVASDAASDSIDLQEAIGSINYNLPYKWTIKRQRRGRHDRVNSLHSVNYVYDLTMANSVEDRKRQIIARKKGYHDGVFGSGQFEDVKITRDDLYYMLTGTDQSAE